MSNRAPAAAAANIYTSAFHKQSISFQQVTFSSVQVIFLHGLGDTGYVKVSLFCTVGVVLL